MREQIENALRKTEEGLVAEFDAITRLPKLATLSVSEAGLEPILDEISPAKIECRIVQNAHSAEGLE